LVKGQNVFWQALLPEVAAKLLREERASQPYGKDLWLV
jgi:hypothetical protein